MRDGLRIQSSDVGIESGLSVHFSAAVSTVSSLPFVGTGARPVEGITNRIMTSKSGGRAVVVDIAHAIAVGQAANVK